MAWKKKEVYVITAFFKDFEESGYDSPSEEFFADTLEEAEYKKAELLKDDEYEDVLISDDKQEREFWVRTLEDMIKRAESIRNDQKLNDEQKDRKLAGIMTDMEGQYRIPLLRDPEWEVKNPEVIQVYRKISDMRSP